ncbi:MAG: hypothetical protein P8N02_14695, partial [Actinomycetota bacterium]|nr:hypothetical protein [Actinomycetota bacterium]
MPGIDTPLLVIGHGPAALVAAKVVSGAGVPCVVAGHEVVPGAEPVTLDRRSLEILEPHGVLGVLRPYASTQEPFAIAPERFEAGLKHHCVADMLITVFDGMALADHRTDGDSEVGTLTDGRSNWDLRADSLLDVATLAT